LIVMKQKAFEKIMDMLQGYAKVLVVGCNGCAGIYQVGGEKQAEVMRLLLEMARRLQKVKITAKAVTVLRQCDRQIAASTLNPVIEEYDAILSMACGAGVQTLAEVFPMKRVIPATDTQFIGMQDKESGDFFELCSACGDCVLFETGGVCPITRCAKGLLNGPCGGCVDGKCEVPVEIRDEKGKIVKTVTVDCAWYQIFNRLKEANRLDLFRKYRPPRNQGISSSPRQL
jgi:hypothetical protein